MRAYIAVVLDSFHEACASRILYILIAALTLVLAALAPFGTTEQRNLKYDFRSIRDWPAFIKELRRQAGNDAPSPGKRIVELAGDPIAKIANATSPTTELDFREINDMVDGLNALLVNSSLYDEEAWNGVRLRDTTRNLLTQGPEKLSHEDLAYFNSLLLRDAFPAHLSPLGDKELYATYGWWTIPEPIPGGKALFSQIVKAGLAAFMNFFVGSIAIFVAVLVTASMIPRTFEPGAIDLLLSKPISRSLLVVAKYFGGCTFILLSSAYFITGLWLVIGFRLNIWSEKLLLCIPIFMFQFAIYYSVSMLAGVIWRNAIVSIAVTVLFFVSCFSVRTAKVGIEQAFINPNQLFRIVPTNDGIVCTTRLGEFVQWNEGKQQWDEVSLTAERHPRPPMAPMMPAQIVGPVYNQNSQSLMYVTRPLIGASPLFLGAGSEFITAKWSGNWKSEGTAIPPSGTSWIFQDAQDNILLVSATGVFTYAPPEGQQRPKPKILGFELPLGPAAEPFTRVGPEEDSAFSAPYSAAIDHQTNRMLIDNEQSLMLLNRADEAIKYSVQKSVDHNPKGPTLLGLTKNVAVVVQKAGVIQLCNVSDLKVENTFSPAGDNAPLAVETSGDGRFIAVLYQNGILWLYDEQSHKGQILDRHISAVTFQGDNLLSADSVRQIHVRDLTTNKTVKVYSPKLGTLSWYYHWLIQPLYTLFPKPGELSNIIGSVLTDGEVVVPQDHENEDLRTFRDKPDTTTPIVHGVIFVLLMLGVTCAYVERLDL